MPQEEWIIQPGESRTIDFEVVRSLKVSLIGGQVDVIGHDGTSARVEVNEVRDREIKVSIDGDRLEVDHPQWRWDNFIDVFKSWTGRARADVTLLVPHDVALKLGVVSATALVSGLTTNPKLNTVSGEVTADGIIGNLDLNTVSGEFTARDHRGDVAAHTVSGDVTVSGEVRRLAVDGVSGNVYLDLFGSPTDVRTNTVSGDTTLRIASDLAVHARITTVSGVAHLDGTTMTKVMGKAVTHDSGPAGGPGLDLASNSVSGNISLVRRADAGTPQPTHTTNANDAA